MVSTKLRFGRPSPSLILAAVARPEGSNKREKEHQQAMSVAAIAFKKLSSALIFWDSFLDNPLSSSSPLTRQGPVCVGGQSGVAGCEC